MTITDDSTTLWSSQHCPAALPTTTAVPRRTTPDEIRFTWNAKESVPGCFGGHLVGVARGSTR